MTSEELGEVFKGDSADMCARKFLLVSMGGRANGQAFADGDPHRRERKYFFFPLATVVHNPRRVCRRVPKLKI